MANLEDKLLGEKLQYYCSSSSSSDNEQDDENLKNSNQEPEFKTLSKNVSDWSGSSQNTGPKGVVQDWEMFKKFEAQQRDKNEKAKLELIKKLSITTSTNLEEDERKKNEEIEAELEELMNDDYILKFQKERMIEMMKQCGQIKTFGKLINIESRDEFLNAVEKEDEKTIIIIHIYENNIPACCTLNKCIVELAAKYENIKFCKILCSIAGMSINFKLKALPAILIYKANQVIGNFISISDELTDDFHSSDLENYFIENGIILNSF